MEPSQFLIREKRVFSVLDRSWRADFAAAWPEAHGAGPGNPMRLKSSGSPSGRIS